MAGRGQPAILNPEQAGAQAAVGIVTAMAAGAQAVQLAIPVLAEAAAVQERTKTLEMVLLAQMAHVISRTLSSIFQNTGRLPFRATPP